MTNCIHRGRRLLIATGFFAAVVAVPLTMAVTDSHGSSGVERPVAGCILYTDICWPDPPAPWAPEAPPPASPAVPIQIEVENKPAAPPPPPANCQPVPGANNQPVPGTMFIPD